MFNDISDGDAKNLISLEGRDLKNGCTILLRGGGGEELARVKRVIKSVLLVKVFVILLSSRNPRAQEV